MSSRIHRSALVRSLAGLALLAATPLAASAAQGLPPGEPVIGTLDCTNIPSTEVLAFSFAMTQNPMPPPGGTGGVHVHDISITKSVDKASPNFFRNCCVGTHIPNATLTVRKAGGDNHSYYVIHLEDCLVTSFQTSAGGSSSGGDRPTESISMNFTRIEFRYTQTDDTIALGCPAYPDCNPVP